MAWTSTIVYGWITDNKTFKVVSMTENLSIPNYFYQYIIALAGLKRVLKRSLWALMYAHRFTWSDQNSQMMFNMLTWYCSDQTLSKTSCGSLVSWSRSEEEKSRHVWLIRSKESFLINPKCALVCRLTNNHYYIYHSLASKTKPKTKTGTQICLDTV